MSTPPAEGYGAEEPDLIQVMHTDEFNGAEMREGMQLQGKDPDGTFRLLRVVKVDSVRPATDEEIEAGQAL